MSSDPFSCPAGLLHNGAGECDAWTNLLVDVLHTEGVASAMNFKITPRIAYEFFVVKPLQAQGSGNALLTGQSETMFDFHSLVRIPGVYSYRIYDPSYFYEAVTGGPNPAVSLLSLETLYENHAIAQDRMTKTSVPVAHESVNGKRSVWPPPFPNPKAK